MQFDHSDPQPGLTVDDTAKAYLQEAARWGKFIAIFGIVISGLMMMLGLLMAVAGATLSYSSLGIAPGFVGILYIIFSLIYLYPCIALLRFSVKVKEAIILNNNEVLNSSFRFLNNHFKSIGILVIVTIFVYVLIIIFAVIVGGVAALSS